MNENQRKIINLAQQKDISRMNLHQICRETGITHAQSVKHHLDQLKKKGLIYYNPESRKNEVAEKGFKISNVFSLPILGAANCGKAIEPAQEDIQGHLKVSPRIVDRKSPDGLFVIRAVGDSLNKAKIKGDSVESGDYIIVDCKSQPNNGDYVLSVMDGAANFKRFYKDDKKKEVRLVSESTLNIPPIILHEDDISTSGYMVNGVVVKVIKN